MSIEDAIATFIAQSGWIEHSEENRALIVENIKRVLEGKRARWGADGAPLGVRSFKRLVEKAQDYLHRNGGLP